MVVGYHHFRKPPNEGATCHIFQFPATDLHTTPFNLTTGLSPKDVRGIQREELHTPQEVLRKELHEAPRKTPSEAGDMGQGMM